MKKIISPSFDPRDGGIQMLSKIYQSFNIERKLKRPLIMNWKYLFKAKTTTYDLVVHGLEFFPRKKVQQLALRLLLKLMPPKNIIYVSHFTKQKVQQKYPNIKKIRSKVIYNPVVYSTTDDYLGSKEKVILTICRAVPRKNLDVAFSAFKNSGLADVGWKYYFIGTGPLDPELKKKHNGIVFLGNTSEEQKQKLLIKCSIFLHPQIDLQDDFEGYGLAPIEALQFGAIPIIGEKCGLKDAMPNWPLYSDGTPSDIENKLKLISTNFDQYYKFITPNLNELVTETSHAKTRGKIMDFLCG